MVTLGMIMNVEGKETLVPGMGEEGGMGENYEKINTKRNRQQKATCLI